MEPDSTSKRAFVLSPLGIRRAIGAIGFMLPFVLAFGRMISDGPGIESSISSYYHTGMRDVFVGAMCVIGMLLFAYKGYDYRDHIAGKLGAVSACGLALVPTTPDMSQIPEEILIGDIHLVFASAFFLILSYFCLYLFIRTHAHKPPTRQKLRRNRVYKICGTVIALAMLLIIIVKQLPDADWMASLDPVFWLESIAVLGFGISWLTKGEILLRDEPESGAELDLVEHRDMS